jgi:hypothetical protein
VTPPCGSWPSRGNTPLSQVPGLSACTGGAIAPLFSSPLTTVNCFWNGANGLRIGVSSKFVPSATGVHCSMIAPCGRYMNPRCGFGLAAVWASAVQAGIIASNKGRPTVTPAPRRNVRRERCFFVMNMTVYLSTTEDTVDTEEQSCKIEHPRPQCPPWWLVDTSAPRLA